MYSFQVCWVPGKTHLIVDALYRAPLFAPEDMPGLEIDTAILCLSQTSQPAIRLIYDAIDDDYRQLVEDVKNGTNISMYSQSLKGSFEILSVSDNLVLLDSRRIVLPISAVKPILNFFIQVIPELPKPLTLLVAYIFGRV